MIPLINVTDRQALWQFWPDISFGIIAVNYLALKKRTKLYRAAIASGIKRALNYDGICISVLVGDNWLLDNTPVSEYFEDVSRMRFDAGTTHDDYVYWKDPPEYRYHRIHKMLDRAYELVQLKPDFDLIGIVKGASEAEIRLCIDRLRDMNIRLMAFPCSELAFEERHQDIQEFLRYGRKLKLWRWLIGIGSPQLMWKFDADCYSSPKWCYSAALGYEFSRLRVKHSEHYPHCNHRLCTSLAQSRSRRDVIRARHNMLSLVEIDKDLRSREETG